MTEGVVLFRFADPSATDTLEVPGCHCPARIHESETIVYRTQLGAGEWESCNAAGLMAGEGEYIDYGRSNSQAIAISVESWTLATDVPCQHRTKEHGKHEPLAINWRTAALLDDTIRQAILDAIKAAQEAFASGGVEPDQELALPNGSGAPSRASSRGSASRTRTTQPRQ